jgi:hypothetical protein
MGWQPRTSRLGSWSQEWPASTAARLTLTGRCARGAAGPVDRQTARDSRAAAAARALGARHDPRERPGLPDDDGGQSDGLHAIGKLDACTTAALVARLQSLLRTQTHLLRTITAANGSERTGYRSLERALQARFYCTRPYSAWQRGSIEHLNGLVLRSIPMRRPSPR